MQCCLLIHAGAEVAMLAFNLSIPCLAFLKFFVSMHGFILGAALVELNAHVSMHPMMEDNTSVYSGLLSSLAAQWIATAQKLQALPIFGQAMACIFPKPHIVKSHGCLQRQADAISGAALLQQRPRPKPQHIVRNTSDQHRIGTSKLVL